MTPKRKRRRRNQNLLAAAVGLCIFIVAGIALFFTLQFQALKIAVGPSGSNDAKVIEEMARLFARERQSVRLVPIVVESAENAASLFRDGKADLAVMRSDELAPQARAISILRKNTLVIWAPVKRAAAKGTASKIDKIQSLAGNKIGLLGRAPANLTLLKIVLEASGVPANRIEIKPFASNDADTMAADTTLSAYATIGPSDSKLTIDAIAATVKTRGEPIFLPVDAAEAIAKRFPQFESSEIPATSFAASPPRPDDAIETIGVNHLIAARQTVSEDMAAALTRQIFTNRQALLREVPGSATLEKPDTDKDSAIPVHPGAAAYIDGTERTFIEKYSDYMWGALLLLSGLGSGLASVRAFLKRDEKDEHFILRERMLALSSDARTETISDRLIDLEIHADDILRMTVRLHDEGAISDGELISFGLVLQHFRAVVMEQRQLLKVDESSISASQSAVTVDAQNKIHTLQPQST